jgi:hypothetical protein
MFLHVVRVRVQLQLILSCFVFCSVSNCVQEYRATCVLEFCDRLERTENEIDQLMHITTGQICSDLNTNYWAVLWIKKPMCIKIASILFFSRHNNFLMTILEKVLETLVC